MVDGGFYRPRARILFGEKTPEQRADELLQYCGRHIRQSQSSLYRIYYYDCPPSKKVLYHPLTHKQVDLGRSDEYKWMTDFLRALTRKRKVAVRRGEELETQRGYSLKPEPLKKLCSGKTEVADLTERDFLLDITQKGVDMRLGIDITIMAERHLVNQIIMISGDSDFVPAAKHARRCGVDFILDPLWSHVTDTLNEHVDGVRSCVSRKPENEKDPLHIKNMSVEMQDAEVDDIDDL